MISWLTWAVTTGNAVAETDAATSGLTEEERRHIYGLAAGLAGLLLLVLLLVGVFVILRVGRNLKQRSLRKGDQPEFADAWSSYRISDEQIAQATAEQDRPEDTNRP